MWLPLVLLQAAQPLPPPSGEVPPVPQPSVTSESAVPPPAAPPVQPAPPAGTAVYPYPYPYPYAQPGYGYPPYAAPPSPPQPAPSPQPPKPPSWMGTLTFGLGFIHNSDEVRLLEQDGYHMDARAWLQLDAAAMLGEHFGLGGWAAVTGNSWGDEAGGPDLTQVVYFLGPHLPIVAGSPTVSFVVNPRVGIARGSLYFSTNQDSQTVPAYGMDFAVLWRSAHIGLTFGVLFAPADSPADLGRHYDMGSYNLGVTGVIDG